MTTKEFKLPEKWCVKGDTIDENTIIQEWFKKMQPNWGWSFEVGTYYLSSNLQTTNGWICQDTSTRSHTPITFEQFKQYVLKEKTNMKNFAITGSLPLMEAFMKESGYEYYNPSILKEDYEDGAINIFADNDDNEEQFDNARDEYPPLKDYVKFTLPSDYEKALQYVKDYFAWRRKEREQKVVIAGYEAKIDGDVVKFGCQHISKKELEALKEVFTLAKRYEGLSIDSSVAESIRCSDRHISLEQINILLSQFK